MIFVVFLTFVCSRLILMGCMAENFLCIDKYRLNGILTNIYVSGLTITLTFNITQKDEICIETNTYNDINDLNLYVNSMMVGNAYTILYVSPSECYYTYYNKLLSYSIIAIVGIPVIITSIFLIANIMCWRCLKKDPIEPIRPHMAQVYILSPDADIGRP